MIYQKNVTNIDSELYSWFPIIFYAAKRSGALYINEPMIIAKWSQWRVRENDFHPLFSLRDGKLTSEEYLNFVRKKISKREYEDLLKSTLIGVYVKNYPAIKLFTGTVNTLRLTKRLLVLAPEIKNIPNFWISFIFALIMPRKILSMVRKIYLDIYMKKHSSSVA